MRRVWGCPLRPWRSSTGVWISSNQCKHNEVSPTWPVTRSESSKYIIQSNPNHFHPMVLYNVSPDYRFPAIYHLMFLFILFVIFSFWFNGRDSQTKPTSLKQIKSKYWRNESKINRNEEFFEQSFNNLQRNWSLGSRFNFLIPIFATKWLEPLIIQIVDLNLALIIILNIKEKQFTKIKIL